MLLQLYDPVTIGIRLERSARSTRHGKTLQHKRRECKTIKAASKQNCMNASL